MKTAFVLVLMLSAFGYGTFAGRHYQRWESYREGYAAAVDSVRAWSPGVVVRAGFRHDSITAYPRSRPLPSCCGGCHSSWVAAYRLAKEEAR